MRQLCHTCPGHAEWQDGPDIELTDGGSALIARSPSPERPRPAEGHSRVPGPFPVGHEAAGRVVAVGDRGTRHAVADLVIVPFQLYCGHCGPCRTGTFAACTTYMAPIGGSLG